MSFDYSDGHTAHGRCLLSGKVVRYVLFFVFPFCMFFRCGTKSTSRSQGLLPSWQEALTCLSQPWRPAQDQLLCGCWWFWLHWRTVTFPTLSFHLQRMHWFQLEMIPCSKNPVADNAYWSLTFQYYMYEKLTASCFYIGFLFVCALLCACFLFQLALFTTGIRFTITPGYVVYCLVLVISWLTYCCMLSVWLDCIGHSARQSSSLFSWSGLG